MSDAAPALLARVLRGGRTESVHRGSIAVVDEDGVMLASCGDPGGSIYLRSAAKPFQVMPLLTGGGEAAFRLGNDEIALMCASHGGEPRHVRVARRILARGGFGVSDLACGPHPPMDEPSARALVAAGEKPSALHNNCSGNHAGLLLTCRLLGLPSRGYWEPWHPVHAEILARLSEFTDVPSATVGLAVDGCSLPVFFLPLSALALSYARLLARGWPGEGGKAAGRIARAMNASPGMVAGRDRFTTDFLEAGAGKWIGKEGAEGVYALALKGRGRHEKAVGIAFKIEDGSTRARDAVCLAILEKLGRLSPPLKKKLARWRDPEIRNARGLSVGQLRAEVSLSPDG
ncbi:MAG: asparaginase [Acidobacteriota bacterium]